MCAGGQELNPPLHRLWLVARRAASLQSAGLQQGRQAGSAGAPALLTPEGRASQVYALTFVHSVVTMFGMWAFAAAGMYEVKQLQALQVSRRPALQPAPFGSYGFCPRPEQCSTELHALRHSRCPARGACAAPGVER